jgi:hypothetical protein
VPQLRAPTEESLHVLPDPLASLQAERGPLLLADRGVNQREPFGLLMVKVPAQRNRQGVRELTQPPRTGFTVGQRRIDCSQQRVDRGVLRLHRVEQRRPGCVAIESGSHCWPEQVVLGGVVDLQVGLEQLPPQRGPQGLLRVVLYARSNPRDVLYDEALIKDERLELIFTCCHPALPLDGQVALTLRALAIRSPHGGPKITWGGPPLKPKTAKRRLHFDIAPPIGGDPQAEADRLVSLGASGFDTGQGAVGRVEMADPDGNEFCVVAPG